MKEKSLLAILTIAIAECQGQEIISPAGSFSTSNSYSLEWTLGETVATSFISAQQIVTQGFNQPQLRLSHAVKPFNENSIAVKLMPNPAFQHVQVTVGTDRKGLFDVVISDIKGNKLLGRNGVQAGALTQFSLVGMAAGVYLVQVFDMDHKQIYSSRFVKL